MEAVIANGVDRELNRINPLAFATKRQLDVEKVIAAFLHASRLGIFEMQWNVLLPWLRRRARRQHVAEDRPSGHLQLLALRCWL